jgi:tetratricopeptide (TPR) repeat protein/RNA polymerase subunit RPABC4/transcription elongation factor Spt4
MINCPYCGKLTDPKLDNCPHCGGYMRRGATPAAAGAGAPRQTCPTCHALVQDGDIICVNCGTNLLTGQKITEEKKVMARRRTRTPLWVWLAIAAGVLLLAVLAVIFLGQPRDTVAQATALMRDNELSRATALLIEHVKNNPDDARAQFLLGRLHWNNNQYAAAAQAFRQAARIDTSNRDAFMLAALSLASANDAGSRKQAVQVLQEMVTAYPNDQEAYFLLGMARGAAGDYPGQVQALRKALALEPSMSQGYEYLGLALAAQGYYPEANEQFDTALTAQPENSDLKAAKAFVSGVLGDGRSSETLLREAVQQKTSIQGVALTQLGLSLVQQGQFQEAIQYLEQARAAGVQTDTARLFYGIAQAALGNSDQALSAFAELSGKKGSPQSVQADVLSAQLYLQRDDIARAQESIDRAVANGGSGPLVFTTKGRVHVAAGQDAEAREAFKAAIQADPNYPPAYMEYGLFHITREQAFPEGIRKLERYLELLDPAEREAYGQPIEDLVRQLKQTGGPGAPAPAQPGATSGVMS